MPPGRVPTGRYSDSETLLPVVLSTYQPAAAPPHLQGPLPPARPRLAGCRQRSRVCDGACGRRHTAGRRAVAAGRSPADLLSFGGGVQLHTCLVCYSGPRPEGLAQSPVCGQASQPLRHSAAASSQRQGHHSQGFGAAAGPAGAPAPPLEALQKAPVFARPHHTMSSRDWELSRSAVPYVAAEPPCTPRQNESADKPP